MLGSEEHYIPTVVRNSHWDDICCRDGCHVRLVMASDNRSCIMPKEKVAGTPQPHTTRRA